MKLVGFQMKMMNQLILMMVKKTVMMMLKILFYSIRIILRIRVNFFIYYFAYHEVIDKFNKL